MRSVSLPFAVLLNLVSVYATMRAIVSRNSLLSGGRLQQCSCNCQPASCVCWAVLACPLPSCMHGKPQHKLLKAISALSADPGLIDARTIYTQPGRPDRGLLPYLSGVGVNDPNRSIGGHIGTSRLNGTGLDRALPSTPHGDRKSIIQNMGDGCELVNALSRV